MWGKRGGLGLIKYLSQIVVASRNAGKVGSGAGVLSVDRQSGSPQTGLVATPSPLTYETSLPVELGVVLAEPWITENEGLTRRM